MTEWFYKHEREKYGPFSTEEISGLIRAGQIKKSTLVRKHKLGDWLAAEIYTQFHWNEEKTRVRPWHRFCARYLDTLFCVFLIEVIDSSMSVPFVLPVAEGYIITIIVLLVWIPLESLLLSIVGTTPGKFLFGVRVRNADGSKLSFRQAFKRSFLVWWRGEAAGVPIIALIAYVSGYQTLKNKLRQTTWDRDMNLAVSHRLPSIWIDALNYLIVAALVYYNAE